MAAFEYIAVNSQGKTHKGLMEGDSARYIRQQLKHQGLFPLEVEEVSRQHTVEKFSYFSDLFHPHISHADTMLLTRQLATLFSAGMPVEEALAGLVEQTEKRSVKRILAAIHAHVTEGYSLASALEQFPDVFPKMYTASVAAGEQTGKLSDILIKLADHYEKQYDLRQKITQALIYPLLMMGTSLAIVIFLLVYVVPKIIGVFQDLDQQLPLLTRILLNTSSFVQHYFLIILVCIIALALAFKILLSHVKIRFAYERVLLKLPFVGRLIKISNTARFSRTLGMLVGTGVSALESLAIALETVDTLPLKYALQKSIKTVREGISIHSALKQTRYFDPMSIYLISNGEATGKLQEMLNKMADYQEQEFQRTVNIALSLFEPLLILIMGALTLFIVLAVLLPIFSYNQLIT